MGGMDEKVASQKIHVDSVMELLSTLLWNFFR